MLLYYFLGGLVHLPARARVGRAPEGALLGGGGVRVRAQPGRGRLARARQPARRLGLPAAACCGSRRAGCGAAASRTSAGWRSRAASRCCAATCRSASTPGSRSALYVAVDVVASREPAQRLGALPATLGARWRGAAMALAFGIAGVLQPAAAATTRSTRSAAAAQAAASAWRYATAVVDGAAASCRRVVIPGCGRLRRRRPTGAACRSPTTPTRSSAIVAVLLALLRSRAARAAAPRVFALVLALVAMLVSFGKQLPALRLPLRPPAAVQQVPRAGDDHPAVPAGGGARRWRGAGRALLPRARRSAAKPARTPAPCGSALGGGARWSCAASSCVGREAPGASGYVRSATARTSPRAIRRELAARRLPALRRRPGARVRARARCALGDRVAARARGTARRSRSRSAAAGAAADRAVAGERRA